MTEQATQKWIRDKFKNSYPLTKEEETELFKLVQKGNTLAKVKILQANMKFVINVANKYSNESLRPEDLINEGAIGLWRAIESFDYTRGVKFITYAVWWIKAFIARAISEKGSLVRLPLNQQARIHKCKTGIHANHSNDEIRELDTIGGRHRSLGDSVNSDGSLTLEDVLSDNNTDPVDSDIENEFLQKFTNKLLNKIPERERRIIKDLNGIDAPHAKSIREESTALKLSRERIRQLRDQAIARLQNLNSDGHLNTTLQELGCTPQILNTPEEKQIH